MDTQCQTTGNHTAAGVDANPSTLNRWKKWRRRLVICLVVFVALPLVVYGFRAQILTAFANEWVINDSLTKADAIVILGGRPDRRVPAAARLYHEGLAPQILYTDVRLDPTAILGVTPPEAEVTRRLLLLNGVPESAISAIGDQVTSTYDESLAVRDWVRKNNAHTIIIPTDLAHTRRARWIFRKEMKGMPVKIEMSAVQPKKYGVTNWWRDEDGFLSFQNEMVKSTYYWFKY